MSNASATPHCDVCIPFDIVHNGATLELEAVGFLNEGEKSLLGETALARAGEGGEVLHTEEDWQLLREKHHKLPSVLYPYWLATKRPHPGYPRDVSCLDRRDAEWCEFWHRLDLLWSHYALVVRRRKSQASAPTH